MEEDQNYYIINKGVAAKAVGALLSLIVMLGAYYFNSMINQLKEINDNITSIEKDVNDIKRSIAVMDERQRTMLLRVEGLEIREREGKYKQDKRSSNVIIPKVSKFILKPHELKIPKNETA